MMNFVVFRTGRPPQRPQGRQEAPFPTAVEVAKNGGGARAVWPRKSLIAARGAEVCG